MPTLRFTDGPDNYVSSGSTDTSNPLILYFLGGNDTLRTTMSNTIAYMGDGDDYVRADGTGSIYGEAGRDQFDINVPLGTYDGGIGNDVFNFYRSSLTFALIRAYGSAGDDTFNFFVDMRWDFEIGGGRHNVILGGDGNDTFNINGHTVAWLSGGAGDDVFKGMVWTGSDGPGAIGGTGNDIYYVDPASPYPIVENLGEGNDTVILLYAAPYTKPDNVENVIIQGGGSLPPPPSTTITGDSGDNVLTGGAIAEIIKGLGGNDTLDGGGGNDTLYGGAGNDVLKGGDGNDLLRGDAGRDEAWGGFGADTFVFGKGSFSGVTATTCDVIHDFSHAEGDKIRLTAVDAKTGTTTNDAFAFIGMTAFHHVAGELRYEQINGQTFVQGDTNGDGLADFWIHLDGLQTLTVSDFYL